jgi:Flp pilus assembly pilin Flp
MKHWDIATAKINFRGGGIMNLAWIKKNKRHGIVEYILIVVVIVGIVFIAYKAFGKKIKGQFEKAANPIQLAADKE